VSVRTIGLATRNVHKIREIRAMLARANIPVYIRTARELNVPPPQETGTTFLENARIKARYYARYFQCPTLADDSGLVIPALDGFPGVHSARWGADRMTQEEKNRWIVERLQHRPPEDRTAMFVCALVFADRERILWETEVRVTGQITPEPRGHRGFGYDPIFFYPPAGKTFAEMTPEEKNAVSHRGRALRAWLRFLRTWTPQQDGAS